MIGSDQFLSHLHCRVSLSFIVWHNIKSRDWNLYDFIGFGFGYGEEKNSVSVSVSVLINNKHWFRLRFRLNRF
jgi:hypothetical protein